MGAPAWSAETETGTKLHDGQSQTKWGVGRGVEGERERGEEGREMEEQWGKTRGTVKESDLRFHLGRKMGKKEDGEVD